MDTNLDELISTLTETPVALSKYMDPKNDFAFKLIFGSKRFKRLTIHLINDCLGKTAKDRIARIKFLPTILEPEFAHKKSSIVDVMCQDSRGNRMIVEMQCDNQEEFMKRIQFYAAKTYINQLEKKQSYDKLQKVAMIVIANFVPFSHKQNYKTVYRMLDVETGENELDGIEFVIISLARLKEKFSKMNKDKLKNLTPIEKWGYFFIYAAEINNEEFVMKLAGKNKVIKEAFQAVERRGWTEAELRGYDLEERNWRDDKSMRDYARNRGREEGKAESEDKFLQEKILIAKNFLALGVNSNAVASATGLDLNQIEALKNSVSGSNSPVFL